MTSPAAYTTPQRAKTSHDQRLGWSNAHSAVASQTSSSPGSTGTTMPTRPTNISRPVTMTVVIGRA